MIAGTYPPFAMLCLKGVWAIGLTALVWSGAAMGIALKMLAARALDQLSVGIYLALGWAGLIATGQLSSALAPPTLTLLGVGGLVYSFGVIFHIWESLPFQNRPSGRDAALCGRVRRRGHRPRCVRNAR
jgi:hemolysin III